MIGLSFCLDFLLKLNILSRIHADEGIIILDCIKMFLKFIVVP